MQVNTPHPVLLPIALACKRDLFELPARQGFAGWEKGGRQLRERSKHNRA